MIFFQFLLHHVVKTFSRLGGRQDDESSKNGRSGGGNISFVIGDASHPVIDSECQTVVIPHSVDDSGR